VRLATAAQGDYPRGMSTKCSIAYGENFHLYNECFDDDGVYLELRGKPQFEASADSVMMRIPANIWEAIRTFPGVSLEWADKSDAEIRAIVEKDVDERIAEWRKAKSKRQKAWVSFAGGMVYGAADTSRDTQIRRGLKEMLRRRDLQRRIKQQAERLIRENSPEGRRKRMEEHNRKAARIQAARKAAEARRKRRRVNWPRRS